MSKKENIVKMLTPKFAGVSRMEDYYEKNKNYLYYRSCK